MRLRTVALLLLFIAALTGLLSYYFYNRQILSQKNSGQPLSQNSIASLNQLYKLTRRG